MAGFSLDSKGGFKGAEDFLRSISQGEIFRQLDKFGREGVAALSSATPVDSKKTADSWDYKVKRSRGSYSIQWTNSSRTDDDAPIAILLQYGHGTGTGGYVQGRDYINPAMKPVFDKIATNVWKAVTSA